MASSSQESIAASFERTFSADEIDQLGRDSGAWKRLRTITPTKLLRCLLIAMAGNDTETIADLCREFNDENHTTVAYKAFYMRLARPGFVDFMKSVVKRLLGFAKERVLAPKAGSLIERFRDIVIQDGSSFAVKNSLASVFPGRFHTREPAAVEIHATYSGFADEAFRLSVAPDTTHERAFLPDASSLSGKLFLADRGYPSRPYFRAMDDVGASFIVRLPRSWKPRVRDAEDEERTGRQLPSLQEHIAEHGLEEAMDLDVEFWTGKRCDVFRMVVLPSKDGAGVWLCTNLAREDFSVESVDRLYKFRWQVELLFKEWKSYANLRKFDTTNPHIAEGLIWASLAAAILTRFLAHAVQRVAGVPMSTRKVAMCAPTHLARLLMAVGTPTTLRRVVSGVVRFLRTQAQRAHPERDKRRGRLAIGLIHLGAG